MKLFISYSRADAQFVEQLVPLLTTAFRNYTIWYDKHIDGGEDWWQRILTEIGACDVFIYLLSNDSIGSEYCQAECREALRLQKLILPVIVRPKTNVEAIPDDLKPEIKRRNWVNLPDGFGNAAANATLYGAIHSLAAQIPSQALEPLQPTPVTQPDVTRALKRSKSGMAGGQSRNRTGLFAIGIGMVAVLAIMGAIILPSLNKSAAAPTLLPTNLTSTNTALPIVAALPTNTTLPPSVVPATVAPTIAPTLTPSLTDTSTPIPPTSTNIPPTAIPTSSPTIDFVAAAQTFDAQTIDEAKATALAGTLTQRAGLTATAASWTKTPTPTLTLTPNITASFDAFLTARAQETAAQNALNQTATATLFTRTPTITLTPSKTFTATATVTSSATITFTPSITLTPTSTNTITPTLFPTVTANNQWTPQIKAFDGVDMVLVPPGCFMMGSTDAQTSGISDDTSNEKPQTKFCFDKPFWIDKTPVWQAQLKQLGGVAATSSAFTSNLTGDILPVDLITWFEANTYCTKNRNGRLPTEAEWEYAARGPDDLIYPWGNTFDGSKAVFSDNANQQTAAVNRTDRIAPSWVGATDLSGNVSQWTNTIYQPYLYVATDGRENNSDTNSLRVIRGGSWYFNSTILRAAFRGAFEPYNDSPYVGFRCARSY